MKKINIYAVHGYTSSNDTEWFPWLKEQFNNTSVNVCIPKMPDSNNPCFEEWIGKLKSTITNMDENTILIGHSLGCVTLLQYILQENIKIKGAILVSGFIRENPMKVQTEGLSQFVDKDLDIEIIKELIPIKRVITAIDDDIVPSKATMSLANELEAELIVLKNGKHFIARDGYTEFPVLLKELNKIIIK